jgi:signal transduction histidine kinase
MDISVERILDQVDAGVFSWSSYLNDRTPVPSDWRAGHFQAQFDRSTDGSRAPSDCTMESFFRRLVHPDDFKQLASQMDAVFSAQTDQLVWVGQVCRTDGSLQHVKIQGRATRFVSADGQTGVLHFDGMLINHEREHQREHELMQSADIRMQTLYSVGHDLGSPFGLIKMSSTLLSNHFQKSGSLTDYVSRHLGRINSCVLEAHAYLRNAIDLAFSNNADQGYPLADVHLEPWLKNIIEAQILIYGVRAEQVCLKVCPQAHLLQVQEQALRMLASNLVSNAVKYGAHKGGRVTVTVDRQECRSSGQATVFEVQDEGAGIPDKVRSVLYKPFQRGDHAEDIKGTGLGLTLVRHAVQCLKAKIELLDTEKGAHFRVTLPLQLQSESPA